MSFVEIEPDTWINTDHIFRLSLARCHDGTYNLIIIGVDEHRRESISFPNEKKARLAVRKIQETN